MGNRIITIDGVAGSGKTTIARLLARSIRALHINSGALYRAIACKADFEGIALNQQNRVMELARNTELKFQFHPEDQETKLMVDGQLVDHSIFSVEAGELASQVAVHPLIRDFCNEIQRAASGQSDVVVEGRDAGTVVFPDAKSKFYLYASPQTRAERRHAELVALGGAKVPSLEEVARSIVCRDERDTTRDVAPSIAANDAKVIDTSKKTIEEVLDEIIRSLSGH